MLSTTKTELTARVLETGTRAPEERDDPGATARRARDPVAWRLDVMTPRPAVPGTGRSSAGLLSRRLARSLGRFEQRARQDVGPPRRGGPVAGVEHTVTKVLASTGREPEDELMVREGTIDAHWRDFREREGGSTLLGQLRGAHHRDRRQPDQDGPGIAIQDLADPSGEQLGGVGVVPGERVEGHGCLRDPRPASGTSVRRTGPAAGTMKRAAARPRGAPRLV